jgi:hypothetical protein
MRLREYSHHRTRPELIVLVSTAPIVAIITLLPVVGLVPNAVVTPPGIAKAYTVEEKELCSHSTHTSDVRAERTPDAPIKRGAMPA